MNQFSTNTIDNSEEEIDLRAIVYKYLRHWKWFILSGFIFLFFGFFVYLSLDRKYSVSSSVLLKEEKGTGASNNPLGSLQELGLLSTTNNIDNEVAVFSSPNLLKQVVLELELHTVYKQKGVFRNTEVYKASPYKVSLADISPESLRGIIDIDINSSASEGKIQVEGTYKIAKEKYSIEGELTQLPGYINLPEDLGRLFISYRPNALEEDKQNDYVVSIRNPQRVAYDYAKEIGVSSTTKLSSVLNLNMNVLNVQKGIDVLSELVKVYNKNNIEDNNEMAHNTSKFIEERIEDISKDLETVEDDVEQYKKKQKITDIGAEAQVFINQTSEVEKRRIEIETQLRTINLVEAFIDETNNSLKIIPTLGLMDQGLIAVIAEFNSLVLSYDRIERTTTKDNPTRKNLELQLANTRRSIRAAVDNVKNAMLVSKNETDKQISAIASRIVSVPTQERELLEIMRQQSVKQSLYLYLMKIKEETNITMASTSAKAKVITDPIIPEQPVSPKLSIIFLASLLASLIVPIAVIYIKDLLQLNITSREELEGLSEVPIIGEVMRKEDSEGTIVVQKNITTPIVELFRAIRNNIQFTLDSSDKKVILVTSTIPGEGKTFVSINLAASFALSEKKVLLIGMDIRNPKLATDIGFKKGSGLTSYLSGAEKDWKSLLTKFDDYPNLHILQAGIIPPNPNELLLKPILKQLIKDVRDEYDIVILDTAPIGVVSDTLLLEGQADTTIYVTRENVTPKNAVAFINDTKNSNKLPNMYLVINGVEMTKNKSRHGRYGYGYSYGYGTRK